MPVALYSKLRAIDARLFQADPRSGSVFSGCSGAFWTMECLCRRRRRQDRNGRKISLEICAWLWVQIHLRQRMLSGTSDQVTFGFCEVSPWKRQWLMRRRELNRNVRAS